MDEFGCILKARWVCARLVESREGLDMTGREIERLGEMTRKVLSTRMYAYLIELIFAKRMRVLRHRGIERSSYCTDL